MITSASSARPNAPQESAETARVERWAQPEQMPASDAVPYVGAALAFSDPSIASNGAGAHDPKATAAPRSAPSAEVTAPKEAPKDLASRDQGPRDQGPRDQGPKDQAKGDQTAWDPTAGDQAASDQATTKDQAASNQVAKAADAPPRALPAQTPPAVQAPQTQGPQPPAAGEPASVSDDSYAKARDTDLKRGAERRRAVRAQRWAYRHRREQRGESSSGRRARGDYNDDSWGYFDSSSGRGYRDTGGWYWGADRY